MRCSRSAVVNAGCKHETINDLYGFSRTNVGAHCTIMSNSPCFHVLCLLRVMIHQGQTLRDQIIYFEGVHLRFTNIWPNFGRMSRYVGSYHRYIITFSGEVFPDGGSAVRRSRMARSWMTSAAPSLLRFQNGTSAGQPTRRTP